MLWVSKPVWLSFLSLGWFCSSFQKSARSLLILWVIPLSLAARGVLIMRSMAPLLLTSRLPLKRPLCFCSNPSWVVVLGCNPTSVRILECNPSWVADLGVQPKPTNLVETKQLSSSTLSCQRSAFSIQMSIAEDETPESLAVLVNSGLLELADDTASPEHLSYSCGNNF